MVHNTHSNTYKFDIQYYDAFISLGSTCFSACQLQFRSLRYYSLPFDYLFHTGDNHIKIVARCLLNHFKNFLSYNALVELTLPEERGCGNIIQYKNIQTGFRFIHHFEDYITNYNEFTRVSSLFSRRIERLYTILEQSKRVLLCTDSGIAKSKKVISIQDLIMLQKLCTQRFKNTVFDIHFIEFTPHVEYITVVQYNPHITLFYSPDSHICTESYIDSTYAIQTHTMFNYLRLSELGIKIVEEIVYKYDVEAVS